MEIGKAISAINNMKPFQAELVGDKIIVSFFFRGKKEKAGFISEKETALELDGFFGSFTSKFNAALSKIAALEIEWNVEIKEEKDEHKTLKIDPIWYSSLAEKDRLEETGEYWRWEHNL